jgi:PAS domain S-box-containing protein
MKDQKAYQILVIEDNAGDFTLIEEYLEEQIESPVIHHVTTFKKAKALLSDTAADFDVILLDLSLPDKNGESLISEIMVLGGDTPVIVLTGFSDISFGIRSLALGVSDYLLKDDLTPVLLYKNIIYNIERKKINLELEASEKRYSELFHLSPLPMWVYDISDLRFLDVNEAACLHYGFSKDEFMAMTIRDIRPEEDIPLLEASLEQARLQVPLRQPSSSGFFRHRKKNKEVIYVEIKGSNLIYNEKKARLILANDVTDRRNYIETIKAQNTQLREIAWMQSHVLRAPLAKMLSVVDLLKGFEHSDKDKDELIAHLHNFAHEMDKIVKDISQKTNFLEKNDTESDS